MAESEAAVHCHCCGQPTGCGPAGSIPGELRGLAEWRCYSCFKVVPGWRRHCAECGSSRGNTNSDDYAALYKACHLECSCHSARPAAPEDLRDLNHVIIGFLIMLSGFLLQHWMRREASPATDDLIASAGFYGLIVIYALIDYRMLAPLFRLKFRAWPFLLLALAAAPCTVGLAYLQLLVFPGLQDYWSDYAPNFLREGYGWGVISLAVAVGPAFFEELFFRGVMLHRLLRVMSPGQAIIVTAMAFAIIHFAVIGLLFYLLPVALIAGWMTVRTNSLWPAMLLHLAHNGAIVYLEYLEFS